MSVSKATPLEWLMQWYAAQCDGDWEHQHGVRIDTLDNPGWQLEVSLTGTVHEARALESVLHERSEHDWVAMEVRDAKFTANGGPLNLNELILCFAEFVGGATDDVG